MCLSGCLVTWRLRLQRRLCRYCNVLRPWSLLALHLGSLRFPTMDGVWWGPEPCCCLSRLCFLSLERSHSFFATGVLSTMAHRMPLQFRLHPPVRHALTFLRQIGRHTAFRLRYRCSLHAGSCFRRPARPPIFLDRWPCSFAVINCQHTLHLNRWPLRFCRHQLPAHSPPWVQVASSMGARFSPWLKRGGGREVLPTRLAGARFSPLVRSCSLLLEDATVCSRLWRL